MKYLLCAALLFYVSYLNIDSVSALDCFYCSSLTGYKYDCEVNVNRKTTPIANCTTGYRACMTITINNTIERNCAVTEYCQWHSNDTGFKNCSVCTTNLCNGNGNDGWTLAPSVNLPLGLVTFLYAAWKMTGY